MRYFNIPVFIPELGCPHRCIFCDQQKITGMRVDSRPEDLDRQVAAYLETFPAGERHVEIAFFGGNFTGLDPGEQRAWLEAASPWLKNGMIDGIRLSTRPDYINNQVLKMLKDYGVSTIELGAQSLDDEVLRLAGRGHSAAQVEEASKMILEGGFRLGIQMMTGLPGDTTEKSMMTAHRIAELGASETRIYPVLVIRGTQLAGLYEKGIYQPLTIEETIDRCKQLILFFEGRQVKILRLGLHPSEELTDGCELLAGPFHPALKELVTTAIWKDVFMSALNLTQGGKLVIRVQPKELNAAIGHQASNKKWLLRHFDKVVFRSDPNLKGRDYHADHC